VKLSAVRVRMRLADGTVRTSYVYGPTVEEYVKTMTPNDDVTYTILGVESARGYQEQPHRRKTWWEREARPTAFFSKHLGREPISGGAGANLVGAPDSGGRQEGSSEGLVDWKGSSSDDGDAQ